MSTIPPNTNNSVFEETKSAIRQWLVNNKQLDIVDEYDCMYPNVRVYQMLGSQHYKQLYTNASYAACVKFALEYDGVQS